MAAAVKNDGSGEGELKIAGPGVVEGGDFSVGHGDEEDGEGEGGGEEKFEFEEVVGFCGDGFLGGGAIGSGGDRLVTDVAVHLHELVEVGLGGVELDGGAIGGEVDAGGLDAGGVGEDFLDAGGAGGAGHALDGEVEFLGGLGGECGGHFECLSLREGISGRFGT